MSQTPLDRIGNYNAHLETVRIAKIRIRELEAQVDDREAELLTLAIVAETFKSKAADTKGRNAELRVLINKDEKFQALSFELANQVAIKLEAEDLIAGMRFAQRERQNLAAAKFEAGAKEFSLSVERFLDDAKQRREARRVAEAAGARRAG